MRSGGRGGVTLLAKAVWHLICSVLRDERRYVLAADGSF